MSSSSVDRSVAVLLVNLRAEGGPALAADLCAEWVRGGIAPDVILLNDYDMGMADRFTRLGITPTVLGVADIALVNYPRIFLRLYKALRASRPRALLSIPSGVHGVIFAAAASAGIPLRIVHVGTYPWHWDRGSFWKYRLLMRLAAPLTSHLVCVTEHVRRGVDAHFGRVARKIHVIPNGIDVAGCSGQARGRTETGAVLMVGRLDATKDHATLLRAMAALAARGVNARLQLAGDGTLRRTLEAVAASLGIADRVAFLGVRTDVRRLLAETDVFAFAVNAEEGLGIALVEAMAAGVPVVASDVGACREVLADGACGLLVPPRDPEAMADAIARLLADPDLACTLAERARARAVETYDRRAMARRYGEICGLA